MDMWCGLCRYTILRTSRTVTATSLGAIPSASAVRWPWGATRRVSVYCVVANHVIAQCEKTSSIGVDTLLARKASISCAKASAAKSTLVRTSNPMARAHARAWTCLIKGRHRGDAGGQDCRRPLTINVSKSALSGRRALGSPKVRSRSRTPAPAAKIWLLARLCRDFICSDIIKHQV